MSVSRETSPSEAREVFGDRLPVAEQYAHLLGTDGVLRGLIGPREVPRLWDRHLLNCAVVAPALSAGSTVADVGSGAGLPGLVWAIARPDIDVTLIEPLLRRTTFLDEVIDALGLDNVVVERARAEDAQGTYDIVTSRAVAALPKLLGWCMPLVRSGGAMWAIKGSSAQEEVDAARKDIVRTGGTHASVRTYGEDMLATPTTVVVIDKAGS